MGQCSILVIDDGEDFREALQTALESAGYRVIVAANGRTASQALANEKLDLVLTDLLMPDKDGLEVITELKATRPNLPVIAMSGGGHMHADDYLTLARALGAKALLQKPFSNERLLMTIASVLHDSAA